MGKSACGTRKRWIQMLSLIMTICLLFTTVVIPDTNAEQIDIALKYALPDGTIVRLTAPHSAFTDCIQNNLFLQVEEKSPGRDTTEEFLSLLDVNSELFSMRVFDISVMHMSESTLQNKSGFPRESLSSEQICPQTEHINYEESTLQQKSAESLSSTQYAIEKIQPKENVTVSFELPKPADADVRVYHVNENSGVCEDINTSINSAGEVVMQTDHFSQFVMVSPLSPGTSDLTAVTVTVNWIGGNAQIRPTSSTVRLFDEATLVPQSEVVLSADNQWTHTWKNLKAINSSGNKIRYTVQQDAIPDTITEMQFLNQSEYVWLPTDTILDGKNYMLGDSNYCMGFDSMNMQNIRAARVYFNTAIVNGETVKVASAPDASARWTAIKGVASPEAFYLKNGSSAYLCQNKDTAGSPTSLGTAYSESTQNQTLFTYTGEKTLASNANTWVRRNSSYSYTSTADAAQATPLTLYHEFPVDTKVNITNDYQPKDPSIGGKVEYHKRIDFLGDKAGNSDTTLTGRDDYRLYLDIASDIKMPADMVLVLDVSNSMDATKMALLNNALIGEKAEDRDNSFIYRFLRAHPQNHLSIVYFWGARLPNWNRSLNWAQDNKIIYGKIPANQDVGDATIYQNWITGADLPSLPALLKSGLGGTDYGAGLYQAQRLLDKPPISSSATKYMVFMSDGEPTHGLSTAKTSNVKDVNAVFGTKNEFVPSNLHTPPEIFRYGSGEGEPYNMQFCNNANKVLMRNFALANPNLNIFSVGVGLSNSEVLQSLDSGTGRYLDVSNFNELDSAFASILGPGNVVITDTLSKYVNFASTNHMKLTSKSGTTVKTLWENNSITADGKGIIQSVVMDAATKKVTATFVPTFTLAPNTVYTLSFNVQVTPKAYEEYSAQGYSVRGDADTDYGANKTSSGVLGFYSNNNEQTGVSYIFGASGTPVRKLYQKPVIQVAITKMGLKILKTDDSLQETPLPGAEFQLFRAVFDAEKQIWSKSGTMLETVVTNKSGVALFATKLQTGRYFLVETKPPPGYHMSKDDVLINLDGLNITVVQGKAVLKEIGIDEWQAKITNMRNLTLPDTGEGGTESFFIVGSALILLAGIFWLICLMHQGHGKEGDDSS